MKPFTYLIGWSKLNVWYFGSKYSKKCQPTDLWTTYFTSSKRVEIFREQNGESDVIQVRKIFDTSKHARDAEHKVLRRLKAASRLDFLNRTDNKTPSTKGLKLPPRTAQHRADMAKIFLGRKNGPHSKEWCDNISKARTGQKTGPHGPRKTPRSKEHGEKLGASRLGRIFGPNKPKTEDRKEEIRLKREAKGGLIQQQVTCPHCNKSGGNAVMQRWHFHNCKVKNQLS